MLIVMVEKLWLWENLGRKKIQSPIEKLCILALLLVALGDFLG
jgi:hypothetical protein